MCTGRSFPTCWPDELDAVVLFRDEPAAVRALENPAGDEHMVVIPVEVLFADEVVVMVVAMPVTGFDDDFGGVGRDGTADGKRDSEGE